MTYNLTAAVIGSGFMGKQHIEVLKNCVTKTVFSTTDTKVGEKLAKETGLTLYSDYIEMFEKEKPDFVSICLPTPLHHKAALAALERGINVLCEKPFAQNSAEAKEMLDLANKNSLTLMIAHCSRFSKYYEFLRRCIKDKRYGNLTYLELCRHSEKPNWSVGNWLDDIKASGGVVRDLHIHDTDMILNVLGMPKAISTKGNHSACKTTYIYPGLDASVTASASWRNVSEFDFLLGYDAIFENASLKFKNNELILNTANGVEQEPLKGENFSVFFEENNTVKAEIIYYCDCLINNVKPEICLPQESYKTMLISDAELESLNTKKRVEL